MLRVGLVVTSDRVYRGEKKDKIRPLVEEWCKETGNELVYFRIVPNKHNDIRDAIVDAASWADLVIVTGGTGPGPRDLSIDVAREVAEKELPGIGEEHRLRSKGEVGLRALASRASGFTLGCSLILVSPGSLGAVREMLSIAGEVAEHIVWALRGASHWEKHEYSRSVVAAGSHG